jgi:hypothetical protein
MRRLRRWLFVTGLVAALLALALIGFVIRPKGLAS